MVRTIDVYFIEGTIIHAISENGEFWECKSVTQETGNRNRIYHLKLKEEE